MTFRLTLGLGLLALALPGLADDGAETRYDVKIVTVDGDETVNVAFSSDDMGFDIAEMQVGENRSFTDDQGRNILVTREDSGFRLDVDGKTVEIPEIGGIHGMADIDVDVDIDDATRQSIESVLRSAGYDDEVNFVEESSAKKIEKVIRMKTAR